MVSDVVFEISQSSTLPVRTFDRLVISTVESFIFF